MNQQPQSDILRACREKVLDAAPAIIDALIKQAMSGAYQPAKFLFDFVDTAPARTKDEEDDLPGPSLAEILLERLQLLEEENAAPITESGAQA